MGNFFLKGNSEILRDGSLKLGIVGSRSILGYTQNVLDTLFEELSYFDFCIVSGGMYGVDMYAHNLALKYNLKTIFVLPQGIEDYVNSSLYNLIKFNNNPKFLFLSEYTDGFKPRKYTFLERNKVISNLSEVLLVSQASQKSGSISTANQHFKNNKKLITVPFGLDCRQFQGSNFLISRGAEIYLSPETILKNFNLIHDSIGGSIINAISKESLSLNSLSEKLKIDTSLIEKSVLKLILEGEIFFDGEKYFK